MLCYDLTIRNDEPWSVVVVMFTDAETHWVNRAAWHDTRQTAVRNSDY